MKSHYFNGYKLSKFLASHLLVVCLYNVARIQRVIAACVQTLYALRVLRKRGLCDDSLHDVSSSKRPTLPHLPLIGQDFLIDSPWPRPLPPADDD